MSAYGNSLMLGIFSNSLGFLAIEKNAIMIESLQDNLSWLIDYEYTLWRLGNIFHKVMVEWYFTNLHKNIYFIYAYKIIWETRFLGLLIFLYCKQKKFYLFHNEILCLVRHHKAVPFIYLIFNFATIPLYSTY